MEDTGQGGREGCVFWRNQSDASWEPFLVVSWEILWWCRLYLPLDKQHFHIHPLWILCFTAVLVDIFFFISSDRK